MVQDLPPEKFDELRGFLARRGYSFESRPHQVFLAKGRGAVVNLYQSGKLVVGGSSPEESAEIARYVQSIGGSPAPKADSRQAALDLENLVEPHVGSDEAGKGDYFGPLVVCAVIASTEQFDVMRSEGVRDSKDLTTHDILRLASTLRTKILKPGQWKVVLIPPRRYNTLMVEMENLNRVLGWAHARAIEEVLAYPLPVKLIVSDQFGDPKYIQDRLFSKGRTMRLYQTPNGERDVVVAAASVIAREEFLTEMERMGKEYGTTFPRGSSDVEGFAKELAATRGDEALLETAKIHFATTKAVARSPQWIQTEIASRVRKKTDNAP